MTPSTVIRTLKSLINRPGDAENVASLSRALIHPRTNGLVTYVNRAGQLVDTNGNGVLRGSKTVVENFSSLDTTDQVQVIGTAGAAASGTTNVLNHIYTPGGNTLAGWNIGTQTLRPSIVASGLDIACDLTDNEGFEVNSHCFGATGSPFIIGKDAAFYFRCRLSIADVSGQDDLHVGFRRAETANVAFDNYLDVASIGCISGDITLETILNNGATTTTDTTDNWTDGQTKRLEVYVSATGVVTYKVDGAAPTATAAFTFDNGDPVIPFVHHLHATTAPGAIIIEDWEVGYQDALT